MCKAFSCICPREGGVGWKLGTDSHTDIVEMLGLRDDTADPNMLTFARVEIVPANGDYRKPDKWVFHLDERIKPTWWNKGYESACWDAHAEWCKQLYAILDRETEIANPLTDIAPPKEITKKHVASLRRWNSVRNSVRNSVWNSVWNSVRNSVGDSVWTSVGAQIGSLFRLPRKSWLHTDEIRTRGYPFQPAVDLWSAGLVPSFDGKTWRLHGGPGADVLFEITREELASKP